MTLEEKALKFLTEIYNLRDPKIYNRVVVSTDEKGLHQKGLHELLAEFTREEIKAKLEEAADNSAGIIFRNCLRNVPSEFQDETYEYTKKKFEMLHKSITETPLD